jgi:hypothetical protein
MSKIADYVYELLQDDMVSHGLLVQSMEQQGHSQLDWKLVLAELLSRDVAIGSTRLVSPNYVEFIAWVGEIEQRLSRAMAYVENATTQDREFAYWLALRKNVDRYEGACKDSSH